MAVRKLKLIWQQVHESTSHLYQPWSFLNIDKPRKVVSNNINASMTTNDLRNVFAPSSMPMMNAEQLTLINSQSLSKPSVYQTPMETATNVFLQTPPLPPPPPASSVASMPFPSLDLLSKTQQSNLDGFVQPVIGKFTEKEINNIRLFLFLFL